jgi:hypothetical protein
MDLLEKWIWEKYQKNIDYKQLIDASEIDLEQSAINYSLNKSGDLLIPLSYNKSYWGQLVILKGANLNKIDIGQIVDLTDLYFKLKVSQWTDDAESILRDSPPELEASVVQIPPRIFYLKSSIPEKSNYIISYIQERLGAQGKLPWDKNLDLECQDFQSLIIHINGTNLITGDDLIRMASSDLKPQIIITDPNRISDWRAWNALDINLKAKLAILDADLDSMPLILSEAKDCIDLLWFAD